MDGFELPAHKASLRLVHNEHKDYYQTAASWFEEHDHGDPATQFADITEEDYKECLNTDEIWFMQWYPNTPTGFNCVAAPTLERLMKAISGDRS